MSLFRTRIGGLFDYLAGSQSNPQPTVQAVATVPTLTKMISTVSEESRRRDCGVTALQTPAEVSSSPPGLSAEATSPSSINTGELNVILKLLGQYVAELPKLIVGEPATMATRLLTWKRRFVRSFVLQVLTLWRGGAGVYVKQIKHTRCS